MPGPRIHHEIDSVDRTAWDNILTQFDDASINQTWEYAMVGRRHCEVSHLLLKQGSEVIACCQTRLRRIPLLNLRVADVSWGPMCCRRGALPGSDLLRTMLCAIKCEYGVKRQCFLRITPHVKGDRKPEMNRILEAAGFRENRSQRPYRTLLVDVSPPLEHLRRNFLQKWRNGLNKAEKNDLAVIDGTSDELFTVFLRLAAEMHQRKDLDESVDYENYRHIQRELPEILKMRIMVCQHVGRPIAAAICSAIGDTGIYMLGATGQAGLGLNGSYLLQWRVIDWLKEQAIRYYDLGAINPVLNPGVYTFKQGIAGKNGWDETYLYAFDGCFNARSRVAKALVKCLQVFRGTRGRDSARLRSHGRRSDAQSSQRS